MKVLKKTVTIVISIALWVIILLAALYAFTTLATRDNTKVANVAGYTPMIVKTGSMSPEFEEGDLILIRTCDPSSLKVGDIITFHTIIQNEYALNTHRIVEINENAGVRSYVTKGDANEISDTHVIADGDIVGKYVAKVPKIGKVMDVLSSSTGFLVIIVLPMVLFFIYQVYHLIMVSISLKRAMAVEAATEQEAAKSEKEAEADRMRAEAEAVLAEAKRLKAEAEAQLAQAAKTQGKDDNE
jgi:signal peptidase